MGQQQGRTEEPVFMVNSPCSEWQSVLQHPLCLWVSFTLSVSNFWTRNSFLKDFFSNLTFKATIFAFDIKIKNICNVIMKHPNHIISISSNGPSAEFPAALVWVFKKLLVY